jgi:hypothetical protein
MITFKIALVVLTLVALWYGGLWALCCRWFGSVHNALSRPIIQHRGPDAGRRGGGIRPTKN